MLKSTKTLVWFFVSKQEAVGLKKEPLLRHNHFMHPKTFGLVPNGASTPRHGSGVGKSAH